MEGETRWRARSVNTMPSHIVLVLEKKCRFCVGLKLFGVCLCLDEVKAKRRSKTKQEVLDTKQILEELRNPQLVIASGKFIFISIFVFSGIVILLSRESDQSTITSSLRSCQPSVYHINMGKSC